MCWRWIRRIGYSEVHGGAVVSRRKFQKLRLGEGEEFRGEGILAVTKALLQSGVSYVAGYQGAPISHLMDVLTDANDILEELGVHFEHSASEATAAATLAASVQLSAARRGHVQIDGRHQRRIRCAGESGLGRRHRRRADHRRRGLRRRLQHHAGALARLRHEVADVAARSASQSALHRARGRAGIRTCRRPANTPVMLELRIRACHVHGRFTAKDNVRPTFTLKDAMEQPGARCQPHRAAAGQLSARAGKDADALARGAAIHPGPRR